jgi:hypothetical protein
LPRGDSPLVSGLSPWHGKAEVASAGWPRMRWAALAVVVLVLLAGCAGSGAGDGGAVPSGLAPPAAGRGSIAGVVVDQAIRPVAAAAVRLEGAGEPVAASTAGDGTFQFADLVPGTYVLAAEHPIHSSAQATVLVEPGQVAMAKLLIERLFTQEPFHETLKFDGFLQCAYDLTVMSSVCVNDYTHFVGLGYTCDDCEHLVDSRSHDFALGPGWQSAVFEMRWEASAQGTSPEMRLVVSHFPRPATHWYCSGSGPSPVYVRMDLGVECEDRQDDPSLVPPEGLPNMHLFTATNAPDGQPAAVALSQPFSVFMNLFYYGNAPEGWSFVRGDDFPF